MDGTIKSVFAGLTGDIRIDAKFLQRVHEFQVGFVNKNDSHIAFFGGNLLGVNPIRFMPSDRNTWFDDVLTIDDRALEDELYKLPVINAEHKVASDVMNHTCVWAMYAICSSPHLTPKQKEQGMIDACLVLQYKYLSSILFRNFPYPADPAVAQATYNALTRKFALKVCGSWQALLIQRAQNIIATTSIHRHVIENFSPDDASSGIIYMINDIQGRLREIVKAVVAMFYRIRESGGRVLINRSVIEEEGITLVKDVHRPGSTYVRYIHEVVDDKPTFIKDELVKIICDAMHTMPPKQFLEVLTWMSDNHKVNSQTKRLDQFFDETVIFAYDYVSKQAAMQGSSQGLTNMIVKLRALYMASRMVDPALILTRDLGEAIVKDAVATKNATVIASLRTGIQLYICLRVFARQHYA